MNKQEALDKIKELEQYIEDQDKPKTGAYGVQVYDNDDDEDAGSVALGLQRGGLEFRIPARDKVQDALDVWMELCMCDGAENNKKDVWQWRIFHCNYGYKVTDGVNNASPFMVYFPTKGLAQDAIDKLGVDKLNTLFMVG